MREQLKIKVAAMVTAIVFVKAEVARIPEVAEQIAELQRGQRGLLSDGHD